MKFLQESSKASLATDDIQIRLLKPFIGNLPLDKIHMGALQGFIQSRQEKGVKRRTINYGLQTVRHILNLAAGEWIDENGLTWLHAAPRIKLLPETDKRDPYPLSISEQDRLFDELPAYLTGMALFKVNTGCREAEVCNLKWTYEVDYPLLNTSVFVIPRHLVKNRRDRVIILNDVAKAVVEGERGKHPEYVFSYEGRQVKRMYNRKWRIA